MVQALMGEQENFKVRVHHFEEMQDDGGNRQANSMAETNMGSISLNDRVRTTASKPPNYQPIERQQTGSELSNQDVSMSPLGRVGPDGEAADPSKQAGEFHCRFLF